MNTYKKYCPNVYVAKCEEEYQKGDLIVVVTKYGKQNECIVHNLVDRDQDGYFYYSITRVDGYNLQERAKRKAQQYESWALTAEKKSQDCFSKSNRHHDFLAMGEPIKVGHHSERRHRRIIEESHHNMEQSVLHSHKAQSHLQKAEAWRKHQKDINLSMPESLNYYKDKYAKAVKYHSGLKTGKYPREHAYSLSYAKKEVNDLKKKVELAEKLWA